MAGGVAASEAPAKPVGFVAKCRAMELDGVLKWSILGMIYLIAFSTRLFSVLRFESVIHEFDPYFNFRTTKFLSSEGFYAFHNWFDDRAWYPLGRIIGGTIYPGLMLTAAGVYWFLNLLNVTINIRNVCVFLAPWMSSNTAMAGYLCAKEVMMGPQVSKEEVEDAKSRVRIAECAGLFAAAFLAVVPGYISRSVAGSYDNEGVAIFALIFTFFLWIRAVNRGSMLWALAATLSYFYMVSAWGGYVFIINLIPMHVIALMVLGLYTQRIYVAYCTFYTVGTLMAMQIPFVGFQPVYSSECMLAALTFLGVQAVSFISFVRTKLSPERFQTLVRLTILASLGVVAAGAIVGTLTGFLAPWTGRFYSLLDPTYAKKHIPIIASVSEHQPTAWASYFFDLHILVFLTPAGFWYCIHRPNEGKVFLVLYGLTSVYFSGVMVRLMLVLAPIACLLSSIAAAETLSRFMGDLVDKGMSDIFGSDEAEDAAPAASTQRATKGKKGKSAAAPKGKPVQPLISCLAVFIISVMLSFYSMHCAWVTSEAYSSPSIVLAAKQPDGSRLIFDDFREAYWWLRMNTPEGAKVMSWWDYGYQITAMANRTILVDNNTWNNTHIATVGRAMASTEEDAYPIMQSLDVDYVLVIFGGLTGYASDDINKFLWMVRIGGGVFPQIQEPDYFTKSKEFRVDEGGAPALLNCMMYKLCYYRFGEVRTEGRQPAGYDRVRNAVIGNSDLKLNHMEEAMTSEHWIVRIYKVKKEENRSA